MRFIDADTSLAKVKPITEEDNNYAVTGADLKRFIINTIQGMPTVDAVPVVRCKGCEYCTKNSYGETVSFAEYYIEE